MPKKLNLIGQKFNRLLVLAEETDNQYTIPGLSSWMAQCDCGTIVRGILGKALKSGNTKSCNCLAQEKRVERIIKFNDEKLKNANPYLASARLVFNANHGLYSKDGIKFDQFLHLSQLNCFYCGAPPSNMRKCYKKNASKFVKDNSNFSYTGLDEIDISKNNHSLYNIIQSCKECNFSKRRLSLSKFIQLIININASSNKFINLNITNNIFLENFEIQQGLRINNPYPNVKRETVRTDKGRELNRLYYQVYRDGTLTSLQFSYFALSNCYYCDLPPQNILSYFNKTTNQKEAMYYQGCDRIDNNFPHNLDNCVPACQSCNYAKGQRTHQQFIDWATRAYDYLKASNIISNNNEFNEQIFFEKRDQIINGIK